MDGLRLKLYKLLKPILYIGLFLIAVVVFGSVNIHKAQAAACNATASGTWFGTDTASFTSCTGAASTGTGTGNRPGSADTVTINSGVALTLSANANITSITFAASTAATSLTISNGATLTTSSSSSIPAPGSGGTNTLTVGGGTSGGLSVAGITITGSATGSRNSILNLSAGSSLTTSAGITFAGTAAQAQFNGNASATINLTGTLGSGGTVTTNSVLIVSTGTSVINQAKTFGTLNVNSGTLTLNNVAMTFGATTIANGASLVAASGTNTTAKTFSGLVTVNSGGTFDLSAGSAVPTSFAAGIQNDSTNVFKTGAGTATFTASQNLAGSGSITFGAGVTINSSVTINNNNTGTVTVTGTLNGASSCACTWNNNASSYLKIGGATTFGTAGSLVPSTSANTVEYTAATPTCKTPTTNNYYHLTFSGASGAITCAVTTVGGNITSSGGNTWTTSLTTVSGNISISGTATMTTGANLAVTGSTSVSGGSLTQGAFTYSTASLTVSGGTVTTAGAAFTVSGTTTVNGGTLHLNNNTGAKKLSGAVSVSSGTLDGSSTAIQIENGISQSSTGTVSITGTTTFQTTASQSLSGTLSFAALTISSGVTLTNSGTTTVTGTLTLTGNWTQGSNSNLSLSTASPFSGAGTFDASTNSGNTVTYTGTSPTCKVVAYKNLTFNNSSGASSFTCAVTTVGGNLSVTNSGTSQAMITGASLVVTGNITISNGATLTQGNGFTLTTTDMTIGNGTSGVYNCNATSSTLNILGNLVLNSGATWTKTNCGTVVFKKGSSQTWTDSTSGQDLGAVQISVNSTNTTVTTSSNVKATSITIDASQTLDISSDTLVLTGSSTPLTVNGTFTVTSSTVQYTNATATITATTFNNLTLGGTGTYTLPATAWTINGNWVITSGATVTKGAGLITLNGSANTVTVTGNANNNNLGSISIGNGSVAKVVQLGSAVTFTDVTITAGATLDVTAGNYTMSLSGNFTNNGTFTAQSGTVSLIGTATSTISGVSTTFNNFSVTGIGAAKTIQFKKQTSNTPIFTFAGTFTITGASGQVVTIKSDTNGSQWLAHFNSTQSTVTFASIQDSGCDAGTANVNMSGADSTSVSNNGTCWVVNTTTISGTIYTDQGTTPYNCASSGNLTIKVEIFGAGDYSGTCTASGGTYTVYVGSYDTAYVITTFVVGNGSFRSVTVTRAADASSISGVDLYKNYVIARSNDGAAVTNTNMGQYDSSNDSSIQFTYSTGNITVAASNTLLVWTGSTYTPGGTVTTPTLVVNGTLSGTNNVTVSTDSATGNGTINLTGGTFSIDGTGNFGGNTGWTFNNLTFGDGTGTSTTTATGTGSITVTATLTISANQTLSAGAKTWILSATGTPFVISGTFTASTSIFRYTGGSSATNIKNTTYYDLELKPSGATAQTLGTAASQTITVSNNLTVGDGTNAGASASSNNPTLNVTGNVTIAANATFTSTSGTLTIGGSFTNNGTFTHNSGTVAFNTTSTVTISGNSTTFNNFNVTGIGSAKTIQFKKQTSNTPVFTFAGTFTITGTLGNLITIKSDTNGTQWLAHFNSTQSAVTYASIQDSGCDAGTSNVNLDATTTLVSNNGSCWAPPALTISGVIYTDEGTTAYDCSAGSLTIAVKVNGSGTFSGTCTLNTGAYTVSSITGASSGSVLTVFVDGSASVKATTVTRASASTGTISSFSLYQNRVIVRHEDSGPISNADLDQYDSGNDADIKFTVTSSNLTVADGNKLIVWTGKTFTPGGTVTTDPSSSSSSTDGDLAVQSSATLNMAGNALSIGGDFSNAGTLTVAGAGSSWYNSSWLSRKKITLNNAASSTNLVNFPILVAFSASNIDYSKTQNSGQDIRFTDSDGTTLLNYEIEKWDESGTSYVWVKVPQIDAGSTTDYIYVYYNNGSASDGQSGSSVWDSNFKGVYHMNETSGTTVSDSTSNANNTTKVSSTEPNPTTSGKIGNADVFDGVNDLATSASNLGVTNVTTISGWVNLADASKKGALAKIGLSPTGDCSNQTGAGLGIGVGNTDFDSNGNNLVMIDECIVWLNTNTSIGTGWHQIAMTLNGTNWTGYIDGTSAGTFGIGINNPDAHFAIGGYYDGNRVLNSTIDEVRVSNIDRTGDWIKAEYNWENAPTSYNTFASEETYATPQTSTFTATATGHTIDNGTGNFNDIVFNGSGGGWSFSDASNTIGGDITITAGTLSGTNSVTVNGGDVTGNGTVNMTGGTFLVDGSGNFGGNTSWTFSNLTFGDGTGTATSTATGSGSTTVTGTLTIAASQTLNAGSKTWTLSSTGTPFTVTGTFTPATSTVTYSASSFTPTNTSYYNLNLQKTSTGTLTLASGTWSVGNNLGLGDGSTTATYDLNTNDPIVDINGDLTIAASSTLSASNSAALTVAGGFTNNGTFTHNSGGITFDGTSGSKTISTNGSSFYDLTFNGSGGSWSNSATLTVAHNLTVSAGTFAGTGDVNATGGYIFASSGTINRTGGTVSLTGTHTGGLAFFELDSAGTFNNLTLGDGVATVTTVDASSATVTISGVLTVAANNTFSASTNTWILAGSGTPFVVNGTFTAGFSIFQYTSTSATNIKATTYGNLSLIPAGTPTYTIGSGTLRTNGTFTIGNGTNGVTVTAATNNPTLDIRGDITIAANAVYTKGSGTTTFAGATTQTLTDNTSSKQDLGALATSSSGTIVNMATDAKATSLSIGSSSIFSHNGAYTLTLTGSGAAGSAPLQITGTYTPSTGTLVYAGTGATEVAATTYYNLTLDPASSTPTYTLGTAASQTIRVDGTLSLSNDSTATAATYNPALDLRGSLSFANGATFTKGTGTATFSNTQGTWTDNTSSKQDLGNVTFASSGSAAWYNASWLSRKQITLNNAASGTNLTNFPILVSLSSSNIDYSKTQNSGQDIRFTDSDGTTLLNYQIEKWDEAGTSLVWVKVPQIDAGSTTDSIWIYYNNGAASDAQNASGVWDSNFKIVSHLPNGSSLSATDSTSNANNGTINSATATAGKVDGGAAFNAVNGTNISYGSAASVDDLTQKTIALWVNRASTADTADSILAAKVGDTGSNYGGWDLNIRRDSDATDGRKIQFDQAWTGSTAETAIWRSTSTLNTASTWYYVVVTYDGSSSANDPKFYINGVLDTTTTVQSTSGTLKSDASYNAKLGETDFGGDVMHGSLDEFRYSNTVRSADWIKAEYNFESAPNTYETLGSEQLYSASSAFTLGSSVKATTLTVNASNTLALGSNTFTLTTNSTPMTINGTLDDSLGTIEYAPTNATGFTVPLRSYHNLTLNRASNTFAVPAGTFTVSNNLTLTAGTLDLNTNDPTTTISGTLTNNGTISASNSSTLTLSGDFTNNGTFTHNNGSVIISPAAGPTHYTTNINGSAGINFYNLQFTTTTPKALNFQNGNTYGFYHNLTLTGTPSANILIGSTTPGSQWTVYLDSGATPSLSYLLIKDSACGVGTTNFASNSTFTNGGNNGTCWSFVSIGGGGSGNNGNSGGGSGTTGGGPGGSGSNGGSSGGGGGNLVQSRDQRVTSGTTNALAFSSNNTAHNLIVAYVVWDNTGTASVSDTAGNTYTAVGSPQTWNSTWKSQVFYAKNVAGGANTVTATFGTTITTFGNLYIQEYSGMDQTSPLDQNTAATGNNTSLASGSVTTTVDSELIFGAGATAATISGAGATFNQRLTDFNGLVEDKVSTAAGSYSTTGTASTGQWVMHIVTFKAAGSGGGGQGGGGGGGSP